MAITERDRTRQWPRRHAGSNAERAGISCDALSAARRICGSVRMLIAGPGHGSRTVFGSRLRTRMHYPIMVRWLIAIRPWSLMRPGC
jgi:hypothetical protein